MSIDKRLEFGHHCGCRWPSTSWCWAIYRHVDNHSDVYSPKFFCYQWCHATQKCCHFDKISITACTGSCHCDNFQCSQWWKFCQNDISISVNPVLTRRRNPKWITRSPSNLQHFVYNVSFYFQATKMLLLYSISPDHQPLEISSAWDYSWVQLSSYKLLLYHCVYDGTLSPAVLVVNAKLEVTLVRLFMFLYSAV